MIEVNVAILFRSRDHAKYLTFYIINVCIENDKPLKFSAPLIRFSTSPSGINCKLNRSKAQQVKQKQNCSKVLSFVHQFMFERVK